VPTGEPDVLFECDEVLIAVGQENAFPWIERDCGIAFDQWGLPVLDKDTLPVQRAPNVFFGGDAAFGPKNIITAVAHGHEAAVSIDRLLHGETLRSARRRMTNLMSQKMGIHEWSYDNDVSPTQRYKVPWAKAERRWPASRSRWSWASTPPPPSRRPALPELRRADGVHREACIECDACVDICPMDCITFTDNGDEADLRQRLKAPALNLTQDLYVSARSRRARDGQGRGRLPALRPVRRALPHRRLGHAEVPAHTTQAGPGLPRQAGHATRRRPVAA
jgi:formate dehydrogenase beta subunit